MTKTKKTKAKAPAQAKATPVTAQSTKPTVAAKAPVAAKPVETPKSVTPKVRLEITKPGAKSVAVAGTFNSWQPEQASATSNGSFAKELTIAPGRYEYMFVVDGQWVADPNAKEFAPNPFGGQNSVLVINN
jgi:1,4-alpha-glucan branching enzyme